MSQNELPIHMNRFQLKLLSGRTPLPEQESDYIKAYNCWKSVWAKAFTELGESDPVYSDAFTRQDLVPALFFDDQCIALSVFRWTDSHLPTLIDDSYFSVWRPEDIDALKVNGPRVVVCSYFTVHPEARQSKIGLNLKSILTGLSVWTLKSIDCDAMAGTMRRDRSVHTATYTWGATPIATERLAHGVGVDLIAIYKKNLATFDFPSDAKIVSYLWENREDFRQQNTILEAA